MPASLFLYGDRIVWASQGFRGRETKRPTCAILIGAYRDLSITTHDHQIHRSRALLVGPNVSRTLNAEDAGFYSLNFDPAHPACRFFRNSVLAREGILDLGPRLTTGIAGEVASGIERPAGCQSALATSDRVLRHFFPQAATLLPVDPRIDRVASWLRVHVPHRADLQALGKLCHLSPGRLTHLFTQELGVSIRTYLQWVKMRRAAELFGRDMSVTEVAATIGFADSAHLAKVFRTYFSAAPSFLSDRSQVHVHACDSVPPPTPD